MTGTGSFAPPPYAVAPGTVAGLGGSIFAACDLRLAVPNTSFVPAFPAVGLIPDGGLLYILPRLIGWGRAREWLLLNSPLEAEQALAWGLVSHLAEAAGLESLAAQLSERLAQFPLQALALTRSGLRLSAESSWESMLEFERTVQGSLITSDEARAKVREFLERRSPS